MSLRENVEKIEKSFDHPRKSFARCAHATQSEIRSFVLVMRETNRTILKYRGDGIMIVHLTLCHHHPYRRYREAEDRNKFVGRLGPHKHLFGWVTLH